MPTIQPAAGVGSGVTFCGLPYEKAFGALEKIEGIVPSEMTLAELALRYELDQKAVSVVLPGSAKPAQMTSHFEATEMPPLPSELVENLHQFYASEIRPLLGSGS